MRTRCSRFHAAMISLAIAALCSGCATFVAHSEPGLSPDETVTLRCYMRYYFVFIEECHVSAVDGLRPGPTTVASLNAEIAPGSHWVEFEMERYFGGAGGVTDVCAFEFDFVAGHRYRIIAHSVESAGWSAGLRHASLELEERPTDGDALRHRLALVCTAGGELCRTAEDCSRHPSATCRLEEGFPYGQCANP